MPAYDAAACVLIVDDNADALQFTKQMVHRADPTVEVVVAHGGPEAMVYLSKAGKATQDPVPMPDLILFDINMPVTGGFEILEWVRRNRRLADVRVVMLSSSDAPADIKRAAELGAEEYLIKFPRPAVLACVLNGARRGTRPVI